jgi:hypothetical protein
VTSMRLMKKLWIGSLMAMSLALAAISVGQTFPTLKGDNARTGQNATPAISNPGRAFLTWFRPNAGDAVTGTIVRNNTATIPNVSSTGGWTASPATDLAAFVYDQPSFGDLASDQATGGFFNWGVYDGRTPAYAYTPTVAAGSTSNPAVGATQSWTWQFDPTAAPVSQAGVGTAFARNYALYVWLPIGSTLTGLGRQFPQRFFVYQVRYGAGAGKTFIDVVDTYAAGEGWVRIGNGGRATNAMFAYDGTTPITITLLNTVPYDQNTLQLTDNPGSTLVYADAAMAVPQVGFMKATPTVSYLTGVAQGRAIAAVNELSVGTREGEAVTVSTGVVKSYNYANGAFDTAATGVRWTFRPAEQTFTTTIDDLAATNAGFSQTVIGAGTSVAQGTTYLTAILTTTPGGTANVNYDPTLEDGDYDVQIYLSTDNVTEQFGDSVRVEVHEGAVITPFTIDMSTASPGWYKIGNRKFTHNQIDKLSVVITNEGSAADVAGTKRAFADAVRFIGAFDSEVNSTPTSATVGITPAGGGAKVDTDVVIVAADDGHVYCLDGTGNGDGTTNVIWAYPSIKDPSNSAWTDPNNHAASGAPDGKNDVTLADMPIGFGRTSPIVQRIGTNDYVFIAARNGRIYCLDAAGRGDYNFATRQPGTTVRNWSYPSDYPSVKRAGSLGSFDYASIAFANVGGVDRLYVPTQSGHMLALNPVGVPNTGLSPTGVTNVLWDFPGRTNALAPVTTTPSIQFGRIYFGTGLDSNGRGHFYSIDAAAGNAAQEFIPAAGEPELRAFVGGPATVDAATLGGGAINTVYVSNQNLNIYALDAANLSNVIWRTSELNTTVIGPLTFSPMQVYDQTGFQLPYPTILVPGENGSFSALFARGGVGNGNTNGFGFKLAWQNIASTGIEAGMSVGAPPGAPGFMYGGDLAGNLFAWSDQATIGGQGNPPITDVITPDNPAGAAWRNAKIKVIDKNLYEQLRNDPTAVNYATVDALANATPAFEWGETAYFVIYGFPYMEDINGNAAATPSLVNFMISTDGASNRQFSVAARQFGPPPVAQNDGYAILAFAIQGSGPNSLPPGIGRVSYNVTPGRSAANVNSPQVSQNPANFLQFRVLNPLAVDMSPAANDDIGVTTVKTDPGAQVNGSPDLTATAGNNESLLTANFGLTGHAQTGLTTIRVYDRSLMTFLRGPGRGVDNVRVVRPELEWLGGAASVVKPIGFGLFEDLPDERPNVSLDYPNIKAENVRVVKDPNGQAENPGFSGVILRPPLTSGGAPLVNEVDAPARSLQPTPFEFDVDVPKFQPVNHFTSWLTSIVGSPPIDSGYSGRVNVFVDSNGDGNLNTLGGRLEANRGFWLNGSVSADEAIEVTTPNVDLGSLPGGAGYSPIAPGIGGSNFNPWAFPVGGILAGSPDYQAMFKSYRVENSGNVNLLNVRLAKFTNTGASRLSWGIFSTGVDEFAWLDAGLGLWSDIDATFARMPNVLLQKARVGDRGNGVLKTNPIYRPNPNLDTNGGRYLPAPFTDDPRVAVTVPIGFPVGTYSGILRVIEDNNNDQSLAMIGSTPQEAFSDPTMTATFKVRETRLTNNFTKLTAPMADDPAVLGTGSTGFQHQNLQPTAARTVAGSGLGNIIVAWTSTRAADVAAQPTTASANDQYRIFLTGINGNGGVADARSDSTNGVQDLTGLLPNTAAKWFVNSPTTSNGYPGPAYLYPTVAGESVIPNSAKYGAPALPSRGQVNDVGGLISQPNLFTNFDMAFVGDVQKQTSSGRVTESRIFTTRVTVQANGQPVLDASPYSMPFDLYSQKGKPSVIRLGDLIATPTPEDLSIIAYSAQTSGTSRIFLTQFDYNQRGSATNGYSAPQAIDFGDGFESVASPSIDIRPYSGNAGLGSALLDISFTGKLRGRKNSEVFVGRLPFADPTKPASYPVVFREKLTPDTETGQFRAQGVEWTIDQTQPLNNSLNLEIQNGAALPTVLTAGNSRLDAQTGLIVFDTSLGGKAYLDPKQGTVRLSTGLPLTTSQVLLTYVPKFMRVSVGTSAGHAGVAQFFDNRFDGVTAQNTKYWANQNGSGISPGAAGFVPPRVARYYFTYNRAAAGAGQAARPYVKTMRLGVNLGLQIYTDGNGNLLASPGVPSITVTGNNGPFQVDPVKGKVYFTPVDEDRPVTITFYPVDPSSGAALAPQTFTNIPVRLVTEQAETQVPIEQAVNESGMFAFPDPFDNANFPRPNLVWMFWTSTRAGSPDLYFQTVAPRFAPQPNGN